jgi:hypothetical protein
MSQTTIGPKESHLPDTAIAGGVILRGTAVKRGADLNTLIQATANSVNLGIAVDNQDTIGRTFPFVGAAGEDVTVRAGAAFLIDAPLTSDANGKLVTATTGQNITAHALQAATAADQLVPARLAQRGMIV